MNTRLCVLLIAVLCVSAYGNFIPKIYSQDMPLMNAVYNSDQLDSSFSLFDKVYSFPADVTKVKKDYPKTSSVSSVGNPSVTVALYTSNSAVFDKKCYSTDSAPAGTAFTPSGDAPATWQFLNFTAVGVPSTGNLAIDYVSWCLTQDKSVVIKTTACTSPKAPENTGLYGVVGLGGAGKSADNYLTSKEFAVYASEVSGPKILFSPDYKTRVGDAKATFTTDESFVATGTVTLSHGPAATLASAGTFDSHKLIFDLNTQGFGLPTAIYTKLTDTLKSKNSLDCSRDSSSGFTACTGAAPTEWPVIEVKIADGANITLTSKDYLFKTGANSHTLLFQQLDSTLDKPNYINTAYANHVVIGAPFLKNHFTHFDAASKKVTVYKPANGFDPKLAAAIVGLFAMGAAMICFITVCLPILGLCCLCGIAYCIYKAVTKKNTPVVVDYHVAAGGYQAPQGHY